MTEAAMTRVKRVSMLAVIAAVLAGCTAGEDVFGRPEAGYVAAPASLTANVDWSKAETVEVVLSEFAFSPSKLTFHAKAAYRLVLRNEGSLTHVFATPDFFKAIAVQTLNTREGKVANPYLVAVSLAPGEVKEVLFLAVKPGAYELECTEPLHSTFGMTGTVRVL